MGQKIFITVCLMLVLWNSTAIAQGSVTYTIGWDQISEPTIVEVLVYRSITPDIPDFAYIGSESSSETEYTDTGLEEGVRYYYRLKAGNAMGGISQFSDQVTGLTLHESSSEALKDLCRIVSVEEIDDTSYRVNWSTESNTTGRVRYWRMGNPTIRETDMIVDPARSHSVVLGGLEIDEIYFVRAVAYDASGNMTISCSEIFATGNADPNAPNFIASMNDILVPENGTAEFGVRLSVAPSDDVTASVTRSSGDNDISVQNGGSLAFTPENWDDYQIVTLAAAQDDDEEAGEAEIVITVTSGLYVPDIYVTAVEDDNYSIIPQDSLLAEGPVSVYPQPFQPELGTLKVTNLPDNGSIRIYDLRGRMIWDTSWSGKNELEWDGTNNNSSDVTSGRYFVIIKNGSGRVVDQRVILAVR